MFIGARIALTNEPKKDRAFDSQSELNGFIKEDMYVVVVYRRNILHFVILLLHDGMASVKKKKTSLRLTVHILRRYNNTFLKTEPGNKGKLPLAEECTV